MIGGFVTIALLLQGGAAADPGWSTVQGMAGAPPVVLNGRRLSPAEVAELGRMACAPIPAGAYWLRADGVWGFAGNPTPQGHIRDRCGQPSRRPSLSERGLLYSPGELLR